MDYKVLIAKSTKDTANPKPEETLVGHTVSVLSAVTAFNEILTKDIVNLFNPPIAPNLWKDALICAAWLHDLGKANDHFQKQLRNRNFSQDIRHETLGFVVAAENLWPLLVKIQNRRGCPDWFWQAVTLAISGHHLKFPDPKTRSGIDVCFLGDHPNTKELLGLGQRLFDLSEIPAISKTVYSLRTFGGIREKLSAISKNIDTDFDKNQKLFVALLKSFLVCADVAGSALPKHLTADNKPGIREWLLKQISPILTQDQIEGVVQKKLKGLSLRPFQETVADAKLNTILIEAGCGSGKTAAAYAWAAKNAHMKRLFFCYPTTATSAAGFSDYLQDPDFDAILVHSRANVDYRLMTDLPDKSEAQIEFQNMQLEAFDTWPIPAVVCTVHTVLGLLQNCRRGIGALPSLIRSAFVFDEIHSYSPQLFAHILRFLDIFSKVPVLMMTATLPPARKSALEKVCINRGGLQIVSGSQQREYSKRYRINISDEDNAWDRAFETLDSGGKVLWVCNTVSRAMSFVEKAKAFGKKLPVEPFHSRYRYKDRLVRQRRVIDGFKPEMPAMLAITTQVAEMSLDLSADLLISDYAPIASLIQRLGRLNRFEDEPQFPKAAFFIKPPNAYPYIGQSTEETDFWFKIESWLKLIADGSPQSQADLAQAFVAIEDRQADNEERLFCDWIDDPMTSLTDRRALMEPSHTIDVVRQEDLEEGPLDENVIPMPIPKGDLLRYWERKRRYYIAPAGAIEYNAFSGGRYAKGNPEAWID